MSVLEFSDLRAYKLFDNDEEIRMGSFKVQKAIQLKHTRLGIYIQGMANLAGTEQITQKIYTDIGATKLQYTSNVADLANIVWDGTKQGFLGYIRIDWDNFNLNVNYDYYFASQISGYTRNGDTFFVSLNWDYPDSIYDNGGSNWPQHPIAQQVFGLGERS